jgi:uncharacterized protein YjdB
MKFKLRSAALLLCLAGCFLTACGGGGDSTPSNGNGGDNTTVAVTGVSLSQNTLDLIVGDTATLVATVAPGNATNKGVAYSSDNAAVANVNNTGLVTAVASGTAHITATTADGNKIASSTVTVVAPPPVIVSVTGVSLNQGSLNLAVGDTETLIATVAPGNATNKNVVWTSDNSNIASVNTTTGLITAFAPGTTKITVITADGGKTASSLITVSPIATTGVSLNQSSLNLTVGDTTTLIATVMPSNATNQDVTWSSDAPDIASVAGSGANNVAGTITAVAAGTVHITVKTIDGGKTASVAVIVAAAAPVISSFFPTQAHFGDPLILFGKYFSEILNENSVTFNGTAVTVTGATPNQLQVTVPKNLGASGIVRVTVAGKTGVAVESFTYLPTYAVSTLAGSGDSSVSISSGFGFTDGAGDTAQFNYPRGVAVDATGNVYGGFSEPAYPQGHS